VAGLDLRGLAAARGLRRRGGVSRHDVIVTDQDGAVVIPVALLEQVVDAAVEQEALETWIMQEVDGGASLPGLYPPNAENKARYEASRKKR
jgi:hypothetical protein